MKEIFIYTTALQKHFRGNNYTGYGAVLCYLGNKTEIQHADLDTGLFKSELDAILTSLNKLKEKCDVKIYHTSSLLEKCTKLGLFEQWNKNGWKVSGQYQNYKIELQQIYDRFSEHLVRLIYANICNGISGLEYSEILACDSIADLVRKTTDYKE